MAIAPLARSVSLLVQSKALAPSCRLLSTPSTPRTTTFDQPQRRSSHGRSASRASLLSPRPATMRLRSGNSVSCGGDHDQFQHVNNVHFVRWFESARMFFANTLAKDFSPQRQEEVNRGTGKSFILAGINVRYRRPVLYPDTVSRPVLRHSSAIETKLTNLNLTARIDSGGTGMRASPRQRQIHLERRSLLAGSKDHRRRVGAGLRHVRLHQAQEVRHPR